MEADWAASAIATQGITNMVAAHYPAADTPPPPGTLRVAPHSDTSVLTGAREGHATSHTQRASPHSHTLVSQASASHVDVARACVVVQWWCRTRRGCRCCGARASGRSCR
jgi:hypothetical protein